MNFKSKIAEAVNQVDNSTQPSEKKVVTSIATQNLFAVVGGPVRVKRLQGVVTTVFQTQANNTKLTHTVPGGSAVDLCATANVSAVAVGRFLTVEGVKATALLLSTDVGVAVEGVDAGKAAITLAPGIIELNCSATNTGAAEFSVVYEPLVPGAKVVAI
jgi:hypothetical protein